MNLVPYHTDIIDINIYITVYDIIYIKYSKLFFYKNKYIIRPDFLFGNPAGDRLGDVKTISSTESIELRWQ